MKYFSEVLNKNFDTVADLEEAEKAEAEKNALVSKEKEQRQKDVKDVQEAAQGYLDLVEKNSGIRNDLALQEQKLYDEYKKKLSDFSKKHKNYHMSVTYNGKNVEIKAEEVKYISAQEYFAKQHALMKQMMDDFFRPW